MIFGVEKERDSHAQDGFRGHTDYGPQKRTHRNFPEFRILHCIHIVRKPYELFQTSDFIGSEKAHTEYIADWIDHENQ